MKAAEELTPEKLKHERSNVLRLSRTELADLMGVDYLSVRRWELPETTITRLIELAYNHVKERILSTRNQEELHHANNKQES